MPKGQYPRKNNGKKTVKNPGNSGHVVKRGRPKKVKDDDPIKKMAEDLDAALVGLTNQIQHLNRRLGDIFIQISNRLDNLRVKQDPDEDEDEDEVIEEGPPTKYYVIQCKVTATGLKKRMDSTVYYYGEADREKYIELWGPDLNLAVRYDTFDYAEYVCRTLKGYEHYGVPDVCGITGDDSDDEE